MDSSPPSDALAAPDPSPFDEAPTLTRPSLDVSRPSDGSSAASADPSLLDANALFAETPTAASAGGAQPLTAERATARRELAAGSAATSPEVQSSGIRRLLARMGFGRGGTPRG